MGVQSDPHGTPETKASFLILPSLLLGATDQWREVDAEIAEGGRKLVSAFNRGDAVALASFYTHQATMLPPDIDPIQGREKIQALYRDAIGRGGKSMVQDVSIVQTGELFCEIGRPTIETPSPQPLPVTQHRKFVRIWKFTRSGCKIDVEIWNENAV